MTDRHYSLHLTRVLISQQGEGSKPKTSWLSSKWVWPTFASTDNMWMSPSPGGGHPLSIFPCNSCVRVRDGNVVFRVIKEGHVIRVLEMLIYSRIFTKFQIYKVIVWIIIWINTYHEFESLILSNWLNSCFWKCFRRLVWQLENTIWYSVQNSLDIGPGSWHAF